MILRYKSHYLLVGMALCGISCAAARKQTGLMGLLPSRSPQAVAVSQGSPTVVTASSEDGSTSRVEKAVAIVEAPAVETSEATQSTAATVETGSQSVEQTPPAIPAESLSQENPAKEIFALSAESPVASEEIPPPLATDIVVKLEPAPLEASDHSFPINLCTALRLADARPLVIAAAQASAWVAEARLQRAKVLWVPTWEMGGVYYRHDGYGPDFNRGVNNPAYGGPTPGGPLNQNLNYFYGYGSFYQSVNVTDAIFEPLAAKQTLDAQRFDIQSAKNDALLATANAYFDVHQYRGQYAATLDIVDRAVKLRARIERLSEDLVPRIEVDRSRRLHAAMLQKAVAAREQWRISSANLTQVLRLDPTAVVVPMEPDHLLITLIDPGRPIDELTAIAVAHRPEIASHKSQVRASEVRVRQEIGRPLLPLVLITGFQTPGGMPSEFGIFGEGSGSKLNWWSFRDDISLQLMWQLEGLGFGNLARIKEQRGIQSDAIVRLFKYQDSVADEVTATQALVQSTAVRVIEAERALREAVINYDGNYAGLAQTTRFENVLHQVFRPQEAVKALEQLSECYDQYFATIADYNRAQFALYHAMGYPARDVTDMQPMGEAMDINTERPYGLPVVIPGAPPAAER